MGQVYGYELAARALQNEGADTMFFIMGGPMLGTQDTCRSLGMRVIDVRHEQAAAMMANAYARVTGKAGVCSTASAKLTFLSLRSRRSGQIQMEGLLLVARRPAL